MVLLESALRRLCVNLPEHSMEFAETPSTRSSENRSSSRDTCEYDSCCFQFSRVDTIICSEKCRTRYPTSLCCLGEFFEAKYRKSSATELLLSWVQVSVPHPSCDEARGNLETVTLDVVLITWPVFLLAILRANS